MENVFEASSPMDGPSCPEALARTPHGSVALVHAEPSLVAPERSSTAAGLEPAAGSSVVERARRGDSAAFETLLAEARPRALATAMKVLHDPDDAEDAVQEGFLKAWRNLGRFEGRSAFGTWIHRIVMNCSLDLLRRRACRPSVLSSEDDESERRRPEAITNETPERVLVRNQARQLVHGALAELSPVHRQTVTLREIEEHSYEEIAQIAACPIGTVMSRLHHARKRLAEALEASNEGSRYAEPSKGSAPPARLRAEGGVPERVRPLGVQAGSAAPHARMALAA
jgi:RNA polymerase sigma-70 factor (ECF subfamily)